VSNLRSIAPCLLFIAAHALAGCGVANSFCAKRQECDRRLEDDSYYVCVETYNTTIDALRANEEAACHRRADAQLAFDACRAQLDCDDFEEPDLGRKCDDERDDLQDAREDTIRRGQDQCSSFN
jgi:hypothetical protein